MTAPRDVEAPGGEGPGSPTFARQLAETRTAERRLVWKELAAVALVVVFAVARQLWLA